MKSCSKCHATKEFSEFYVRPNRFCGYSSWCKDCSNEYNRMHVDKVQNRLRNKLYRLNRKVPLNIPNQILCTKCHVLKDPSEFHKDRVKKYGLNSKCKRCQKIADKKRRMKPGWKEKDAANHRSEKYRIAARKRQNYRYKNDINYSISTRISSLINESLRIRGLRKNFRHWESLVGYSISDLVKHLENQFDKGMTWENRNKWHIDHIVPKSSFNITSVDCIEFKKCWALSNLQPLWSTDNIVKSNKY